MIISKRLTKQLCAITLSAAVFLTNGFVSHARPLYSETDTAVKIVAKEMYQNWDGITNVAQFAGQNGELYYAVDSNSSVTIYKTSNGSPTGETVVLQKQHPKFGTVLCDSDGFYYMVTGEDNATDNTDVETIFVSKYDSYGTHVKTVGDNGSSSLASFYDSSFYTKIPFESGTCDAALNGKILSVNYARGMYNGHQSNSVFTIMIDNMKKGNIGENYNSHSFSQRVIPWENGFVYMSEGDCYDRAFTVHAVNLSDTTGTYLNRANIFDFWVADGAHDRYNMYELNQNFAHMGGMAPLSDGKVAFAAQSAQSLNSNAKVESEEIFLQIFDPSNSLNSPSAFVTVGQRSGLAGDNGRDSVTNYGVKWLTSYGTGAKISNVQIASTDSDEIVVLYELTEGESYKGVYYIVVDANGNVTREASRFAADAMLNPCEMPVFANGSIRWVGNRYKDNTNRVCLYSLNLSSSPSGSESEPGSAIITKDVRGVSNLTYTGRPQALVTAGEADGGTVQYALGTDQKTKPAADKYSVTIPTGTDVGTYYVWYKAKGDSYHTDSSPICVTVTIRKETKKVTMYRLYNPNSGEHFYTGNEEEQKNLVKVGWLDEGIGWIAPVKSNTPVYRLYNGNAGDHHYTLNAEEKDFLVSAGWKFEGVGWYSDEEKSVPLYREYNPNAVTGTHNYTKNMAEHDNLVSLGWKDEGIGWYGIGQKVEPIFSDAKIGDVVKFGAYEQDNNSTNGKEEIEWVVLEKEKDKALVISKYALDCQPYNTSFIDVTWATCSLREWLNGTFISNAFSSDEQNMIQKTTIKAEINPSYSNLPGTKTKDKVFLLSIPEVYAYFSSDEARKCAATDYAIAQGAWTSKSESVGGKDTCHWWVRSPGSTMGSVSAVSYDGNVDNYGDVVDFVHNSVRPALWINWGSQEDPQDQEEQEDPQDQEPIEKYSSTLKDASVGDIVKFGAYEQDNNSTNGKEEIEWKVLAKEGNKALVISKYALDAQPYNTLWADVTWETCSLRQWLNETFISDAFSTDEQNMIQTTDVKADPNPKYTTPPGNDTKDKVFLLSIPEVNKYFSSDEARKCAPTEYAMMQGVWTSAYYAVGGKGSCYWLLRSPGDNNGNVAEVFNSGYVSIGGSSVDYRSKGVRPALWINIGSYQDPEEPQDPQDPQDPEPIDNINTLKDASVGDIVKFGAYEQDNNSSNGKEEIEWVVLAKEGDKALVISKYALDCQPYNTISEEVTWETCSLRKWLNGTFISNAFSSGEQNMIQTTTVTADKNPQFDTSPGNDTTDKVFLLSIQEANKYFIFDDWRMCTPTDYAIAQGLFHYPYGLLGGKANCGWWLRSPGWGPKSAAYVTLDGDVYMDGEPVQDNYSEAGVRPALWINIEP